jgi:hypothetical protein
MFSVMTDERQRLIRLINNPLSVKVERKISLVRRVWRLCPWELWWRNLVAWSANSNPRTSRQVDVPADLPSIEGKPICSTRFFRI